MLGGNQPSSSVVASTSGRRRPCCAWPARLATSAESLRALHLGHMHLPPRPRHPVQVALWSAGYVYAVDADVLASSSACCWAWTACRRR
ncbi:hypothetical protein ZWY2020_031600 [Hordeum vulgare]|nr:hypothetical protein ZWY2020_031600 [Hordeum vulgare]